MKVLLISHISPPVTGIARWTERVLKFDLPNDWDIVLINSNTINGRDPFASTKRKMKDELKRSFSIWKQEKKALKENKDITVVHDCIPCTPFGMIRETITGMIAKHRKRKFILHCRCTVPNVVNKWWKRMLWKVLTHYCDGIMVLNKVSLEFAKKYSKKSLSVVIPNFVNKNELMNVTKKVTNDRIESVIFVGGVVPEKGCDTIIKAACDIPEMQFNLIGAVSEEIKNMPKSPNVVLHGVHDKAYVEEQMLKADCFLFLSRYFGEGFSNALVEAMAAGLPCIVTDWAANADMIEDKGGLVVPQQDADALVKALVDLSEQPELRAKQSEFNIDKVKNCYVEDVVIPQYVEFYEKLVASK